MNDIQKRRMYTQLEQRSFTDMLTGLYNRNKFKLDMDLLEQFPPSSIGIVFTDLNGLKAANDRFGHDYGDQQLCNLGTAMKQTLPGSVYRIGGDEFIALCPDVDRHLFDESIEQLNKALSTQSTLSAAVGTLWVNQIETIRLHIKQVDGLMYADKQRYYTSIGQAGRRSRYSAEKPAI